MLPAAASPLSSVANRFVVACSCPIAHLGEQHRLYDVKISLDFFRVSSSNRSLFSSAMPQMAYNISRESHASSQIDANSSCRSMFDLSLRCYLKDSRALSCTLTGRPSRNEFVAVARWNIEIWRRPEVLVDHGKSNNEKGLLACQGTSTIQCCSLARMSKAPGRLSLAYPAISY